MYIWRINLNILRLPGKLCKWVIKLFIKCNGCSSKITTYLSNIIQELKLFLHGVNPISIYSSAYPKHQQWSVIPPPKKEKKKTPMYSKQVQIHF